MDSKMKSYLPVDKAQAFAHSNETREGDLPFVRSRTSILAALIVACYSLSGCGSSSSDSGASGPSSVMASSEGTSGDKLIESDESRFDESGVAVGDVNTISAKALDGFSDNSDAAPTTGSSVVVKAVVAPSQAPSFGPGPYVTGAAILRKIGVYPGGTAVAGRRYRNDVLIPGATQASYTIVAADMGQQLVYEELVERNDTKVRNWFRSAPVGVGTPTMSKAPSFGVGSLVPGTSITRVVGEYPGSTPVAGRRYRDNVLIAGATGASYAIDVADVGHQLVYEEEVEANDSKVRKWFRSAAVAVPSTDPGVTRLPSIGAGPFSSGTVLTRVVGVYPGSTPVAGRRYRNNVLIAGATSATYTIVAADIGQQLVYEEEAKRDDTGASKWFRSAAGVPFGSITPPPPPPPPPGVINSADIIVSDMRMLNDFVLKGYESFKNGWYVGPGVNSMGNDPSFSNSPSWSIFYQNPNYIGKVAQAALPWVVIFDGVDHAASNVAVEIRNMRTYIKSRASGKWVLLGGPVATTGTYYGKPNTGLPALDEVVVSSSATSSAIKVPENRGYFWHGWWGAGRLSVDPTDIAAMFVTVQARMVVADASRADDRAKAQVGLQVGADYYLTTSSIYPEAYAPAIGINRTRTITNDWQAYNFTTFSDVGVQDPGGGISEAAFRAAPPPME